MPPIQNTDRRFYLTPRPPFDPRKDRYDSDLLKFHPKCQPDTTLTTRLPNLIPHDPTSPESLRSRAIYDVALAHATRHGPSLQWAKAVEHGKFTHSYHEILDAHLQHRLSYPPFLWDALVVPEIYHGQNQFLLRLEWSYRSAGRAEGESGMWLTKGEDRGLFHREYEFEEWVPRAPLLHLPIAENFELLKLPMEIISCIVEQCTSGDAVALSLTCKTLYHFVRPLLLSLDPDAFALAPRDGRRRYHVERAPNKRPICTDPRAWREGVPGHGPCKKKSCNHCICSDCPLFKRLVNWMPINYRFCFTGCQTFMLQRRFKNGKCYHGRDLPRAPKPLMGFTYCKFKGGFAHAAWKKGYTESDMRIAMDRHLVERRTESGYSLRRKPKPTQKRLEHMHLRTRGRGVTEEEVYGN